jgi:hypothetical protein
LFIDSYKAHITQRIRSIAANLLINLIVIPPGMTDELQPLDRYVFGHVKSAGRRLFRIFVQRQGAGDIVIDKPLAIQFLIQAWQNLGEATLRRAWNIYQGSAVAAAAAEVELLEMSDDEDDLA